VIGPSVAPLLEDKRPAPRTANPGAPPPAQPPRFAATAPPKTTLPSEFVVGGPGAANVFDANQISLAAAKKLARACRDWAASKGGAMSLYVIDNAGEIVHMERMDGEFANDTHKALLKAQTALKTRAPTSIVATQLQNNPAGHPRQDFFFGFFEVSGGIPIVVDGQMIGAVGVSGEPASADPRGDENCAVEGLKVAFGEHVTLPVYPPQASGAN
jgi:uncharacterized protein GlcG (DUF336 family)